MQDCDWEQLEVEHAHGDLAHQLRAQVASERRTGCKPVASPRMDPAKRDAAIAYMLGAQAAFGFRSSSIASAITMMDRYWEKKAPPQPSNEWVPNLLAVACLSLAIKMEEVLVPPLLQLQINAITPHGLGYDASLVMKMELSVSAALDWRLVTVTPFEYIDRMLWHASLAGPSAGPDGGVLECQSHEVRTLAYDLLRQQLPVTAPLRFAPSVRAAAAVSAAAGALLGPAWGDAVLQALAEVINVDEDEERMPAAKGATAPVATPAVEPHTPRVSSELGAPLWDFPPGARPFNSPRGVADAELAMAAASAAVASPADARVHGMGTPGARASGRCTPVSAKEDEIFECQKISRNSTPDSILDSMYVFTPGLVARAGKRTRDISEPPTPEHFSDFSTVHASPDEGIMRISGRYALRERSIKVARSL